jgi:hypothetical protein
MMNLIKRALQKITRDYCQWSYHRVAKQILDTPPIVKGDMPFMLLSMVHKRDVLSYLVAVKSFTRHVNPRRIVIVCDPSIDTNDRAIFQSQIPHVELRRADEFVHPDIPRGGCWERLFAISEYNRDQYVIQLDADTVTALPIDEVASAITNHHGFVLGEIQDQGLLSFKDAGERAAALLTPQAHIQTRSEAALPTIGLGKGALYVRGCAGFTGFPASQDMRERLVDFSHRMHRALGNDWASWGTEQVTSNYLVANADRTEVLPFPKYGTPDQLTDKSAFLHFIGSMRFINMKYQIMTTKSIKDINQTALQ